MTVTIFGSTGLAGKHLVKQALHTGYSVRAFGRNVHTAGFPEDDHLKLVAGALFDEGQVYNAIDGSDAVFSVSGGATDGSDHTRSLGIKIIAAQMLKAGVKRIIALGGTGILKASNESEELVMDAPSYSKELLPVGYENLKAYEVLKNSFLDWTFVCSPDIMDADATGLFQTSAEVLPVPNHFKINAGDLAMCMLNSLKNGEYLKQRVGISG